MNESGHYTDEDFQMYFDKAFAGDVRSLESHIAECEHCSKSYEAYLAVWSFAKNGLETEALQIDLAKVVAGKVFAENKNRNIPDNALYATLICAAIACMFFCLKFLLSFSLPSPFILIIIPVVVFVWMSYKEIKLLKR